MSKRRRRKKTLNVDLRMRLLVGLIGVSLLVFFLFERQTSRLGWRKQRVNVLFLGHNQKMVVMSIDFVTRKIDWLLFPKNSLIPAKSLGFYRIDKLLDLARYEKTPDRFVISRVQGLIKLPMDAFCWFEDGAEFNQEPKVSWLWQCNESNLNLIDKLRLSYLGQSYGNTLIDLADWEREGVVKKDKEGLKYDRLRLDDLVKRKFFDWSIAQEGLEVAIVDKSGQELGLGVARLIENLGAHVIMNREGDSLEDETAVLVVNRQVAKSLTVARIREVLHCNQVKQSDVSEYRADMVIILGKDLSEWFF